MSKVARRRANDSEAASAASSLALSSEVLVASGRQGVRATCEHCEHRADDRQALERGVPGLVVFSSGYGENVAHSRLCTQHDQFVSPGDTCGAFRPMIEARDGADIVNMSD